MKNIRRQGRGYDDDEYGDRAESRARLSGTPSTAVTLVGVLNLVVGALMLLVGLCGAMMIPAVFGDGIPLAGLLAERPALFVTVVAMIFTWGLGVFIAGTGVLGRRRWSRYATLFLSAWGFLMGVMQVVAIYDAGQMGGDVEIVIGINAVFAAMFLIQAITAYVVLLRPIYREEFS